MKRRTFTIQIGNQQVTFETGKIAKQANGCVLVHAGETTVLAVATASVEPTEGADFLPLKVDYQEKFSSAGKTLGGFIKREGKPSEKEVLTSRLIDRGLRPLFPEGYYNEVQVLASVYSYDGENSPETLALLATSAALVISDIPLLKPVAGVRVGLINDQFVINPSTSEQKKSLLDLLISGTKDAVLMIEGYCDFLNEEQILEAIETGHRAIRSICQSLEQWQSEVGREKWLETIHKVPQEVRHEVERIVGSRLLGALTLVHKKEREKAVALLKHELTTTLLPQGEVAKYELRDIEAAFKDLCATKMRRMILKEKKRLDGRALDQIRPIDVEHGLLPRTHGSALFTRGETQALAVCTLGGESMAQRFEDLHGENAHRFYMQYIFPPFSVGEVGRMGPPGRREVGHGKLAERSLSFVLPAKEAFPYVIRLESNITESNGSSSMASVCGGCLAMMDAGVPIKRPVAGIAMGLILEDEDYVILSDILGTEDALGDMDFKLAGDAKGITAFQMDIKIEGITPAIMKRALDQAKDGRIHILDKMLHVMKEPKQQISLHAPRIAMMKINPSKIGTVIGPGGKQIRAIAAETGATIDINDEGIISIASPSLQSLERAKEIIHNLTAEVELNKVYKGRITSIMPFGVFVELVGGKEGLCHISQLSNQRIENIRDFYKEGDSIEVKVLEISDEGKVKLSHKVLLEQQGSSRSH